MSENVFYDVIRNLAERQRQNNPPKEGDYVGEDGFLYCGNCKTKKETLIDLGGSLEKVPSLCQCEKEKVKKEEDLERQRLRQEKIDWLKSRSNIESRFRSCSFDSTTVDAINRSQIELCEKYAKRFDEMYEKNQGLLLYGDVGTGKTHVACCIGNYLMEQRRSVYATSFIKVLQKARFFGDEEDEESFIGDITDPDLLILDDLGAERGTDYALEVVYNVVNSRYNAGKPMIVTTNLTLEEMQDVPDRKYKRIYDRIFEVCYPLEFKGKSLRMKEAANRFDSMKDLLEGRNEN